MLIIRKKNIFKILFAFLFFIIMIPSVKNACKCGANDYGYPTGCKICGYYYGKGKCSGCTSTDTRYHYEHKDASLILCKARIACTNCGVVYRCCCEDDYAHECHTHNYNIACCANGNQCSCGAKNHSPCHSHNYNVACCYNGNQCSCGAKNHSPCHSHSYSAGNCQNLKTCVCGATNGYGSHSMGSWQQNNSTTHKKPCTISGCTYAETANHYDNDSNYSCDVCGYDSRTPIAKPSAVSGLTYNGSSQTGVSGGTGYTLSDTTSAIGAGSYTATAKISAGYKWSDGTTADVSINWSIAKKSISTTWTNTSFIYNGGSQKPTATVSSGVTGETINLSVTGEQVNVGDYTATASIGSVTGGQGSANNYTLTNTTSNFTIAKKSIAAVWVGAAFTYNGTAQGPTASAESGVTGETVNITATKEINVGSYTSTASMVSVTGGQGSINNYTLTNTSSNFTIAKKSIAVEWGGTTFTYNGAAQGPTASVSSGVTGETINITATKATNAGSYTSTASMVSVIGGQGSVNNYTLTNTTSNFTIAKKSIAVVWGGTTFTYNGTAQGPTASVSSGVTGETVNIIATTATNAGNYTSTATMVSVVGGQALTTNYNLTNNTVAFVINKAPRTISISDNSFEVWANGTVQFTYTGEDVTASVISSNTGVATVRMNDGPQGGNITVTPVWIGNTILTVSVPTSSNYLEKTSTCVVAIYDNTRPVITIGAASKVYVNSVATITIPIEINEAGTGLVNNTFTASDINVYVAGGAAIPTTKQLTFVSLTEIVSGKNSGIYRYTLTLSGIPRDGDLSVEIPAGSIEDKAGNTNLLKGAGRETLGSLVDNTKPVIELDGASSARYINSTATLTVPLKVTDTGAGIETSELLADDITVLVNDVAGNYSGRVITYLSELNGVYRYRLTLTGVQGNGPLKLRITANKVIDRAENGNVEVTLDPTVLVDNIKPVVSVTDVAPLYAKSSILVTITVNENGSGMELDELVKSDITLRVDGQTITEANKGLTWVSTINGIYTYRLTVTNLTMTGRVEIDIPRRSSKR